MAIFSARRRAYRYALSVSALAVAALSGTAASAQCVPDPPLADQTTKCDGTQTGGLVVASDRSTVQISEGAVLSSSTAAALLVARQSGASYSNTTTIVADGAVQGIGQYGIEFRTGARNASFNTSETLRLTVGASGSVTGTTGIAMTGSAANPYGYTFLVLDNSGTISGTSGRAIQVAPNVGSYLDIVNQESGVIGAISGVFSRLDNKGVIDGGQNSAIDGRVSGYIGPSATLSNSGIITSSGAAATVMGIGYNYTLINSGTISNSGTGMAIDGNGIRLTNETGGSIRAGSDGTAIRAADGGLQLVNSGTIDGDVLIQTAPATYVANSSVDSTRGAINGDLIFGAGNDTLVATMKDGALFTGVTGAINGGEGNDGILLDIRQDSTIATGISVPGFDYLRIATASDATTTLADGFAWAGPLTLSGSGTVINRTNLVANGYLGLQAGDGYAYSLEFSNLGTITGNSNGNGGAISLYGMAFDNAGTIDIIGDALRAGGSVDFTNSGTITATNNAVVFSWGPFANSGTIRSTAGTALTIEWGAGNQIENSGTIDGAKVGVRQMGGTLFNSGLISSAGTAVVAGGTLYNQAGGVIRGGTMAIGPEAGAGGVYGATVINAGTIEGDVYLASNSPYSGNTFFAQKGGVLNGDLTLSKSDTFIADLSSRTGSGFTGINGTVTANGAALRYQVTSDATQMLGKVADFGSVSYEVAEGATLGLNAARARTESLTLGGHGTVDLDADFTITDGTAITVAAPFQLPGASWENSDLLIVSHGDITIRRQDTGALTYPEYGAAVYLGSAGQFTNKGTISYQNALPANFALPVVIREGGKVVNDGTILLDRAIAISGAAEVINNGSIIEAPGGTASQGITAREVTNNGIVRVGNQAVWVDSSSTSIDNAGTLESLTTAAISGYTATIRNDAAGVIRGGNGTAIQLQGGSVVNSGSIIGTVDLAYAPYGGQSYYPSSYIAQGGTLQGDLLFGAGNDLFYAKSGTTGVTGIIDGGEGRDIFGTEYAETSTVAVDRPITEARNFEERLSVASGSDTTLTLVADTVLTSAINVGGDGRIINRASTTDLVGTYQTSLLTIPPILASFTNEADIGGASISTRSFTNSGNIGTYGAWISANDVVNFDNSGSIAGTTGYFRSAVYLGASDLSTLTASNDGIIDGGMTIAMRFSTTATSPAASIVNKGTIRSTEVAAVNITASGNGGKGAISFDNQGVIEGDLAGISVYSRFDYPVNTVADTITAVSLTNSGTIRTSGDGVRFDSVDYQGNPLTYVYPAVTIRAAAPAGLSLNNKAGGLIAADGQDSIAILSAAGALTLVNDGIVRGSGWIDTGSARLAGAVQTGAADDYIRNNGTIAGSLALGDGSNRVENYGTIDGDVTFGSGDDSYTQSASGVLTGTVDGGAGINALIVDADANGTYQASRYRNFQNLRQIGSGTIVYAEPASFDSIEVSNGIFRVAENNSINSLGTFAIIGGRVVGALGSTMTARRFDVASGATFGSAGTVNGDVNVQGTLSPGASPGTMTINGALSLASGSTTLFEITPTVSDAIVVNGKVTIADGATLTLTGSRPLTPGVTYDLITASDSISGRFSTINAPATLGLIVQTADGIELRGQFMLTAGANAQAARVADYLNGVLADASLPAAMLAAVPSLLDANGFASDTAMRQLSPEAYASATQIGVEKGLALVSASRSFAMGEGRSDAGLFTFGQVFGGWRDLPGQAARGTARADISAHGLVGGVGYGSERASIGAFVGWASASQRLRELGASTDADGVIAGVVGKLQVDRVAVTALVAHDGSNADTDRALPGDKARGHYDLNSWIYDVHLSYDFDLSDGWTLSPELGATRIDTKRAAVREADGTPFDLSVSGAKTDATFLGAALKLTGSPSHMLQPWLSAGARSQLSGRTVTARADFTDISTGSMLAYGAGRSRTLATVSAGLNARLSQSTMLMARVGSEFGADSTGQEASVGLQMRF
ncbi:autotransporter outer membrane beta-barrel domain-containing protein [Sphingomonas cannabina]|uniref:autotransporter outer membrane beta-barrel domain-containing protein n=1 Tax=Sphingomonas cannabina TaxID=2899123 RepID=UPI001F2CF2BC|nr:autotransporter outer membrane beta-barrel domain-containing protein [Sphingomonas cannabina]UIJ45139.1 autotransporter outer membrane beta-barrel domain-containing protein [Sphingomonas cannabina]